MTQNIQRRQPPRDLPLRDLKVAITGGTSGLGLALLRQLADAGASVAFVARDAARLARIAASLPGTHGFPGDVAEKSDIYPLATAIAGALGGLDVLINNASDLGPVPLALLGDTDCEDLERALATNLLGPFRLTKALLGALAASAREGRGGVVVNISSDAAVTPYPGWGAYGASKAALHHLSRIWNLELVEARHPCPVPRSRRHGHAPSCLGGSGCRSRAAEIAGRLRQGADRGDRGGLAAPSGRPGLLGRAAMHAAREAIQRPKDAKLLAVDAEGGITHRRRAALVGLLRPGDLVVANDAATIPASLAGIHLPTAAPIELRLAGRPSLRPDDISRFSAIVFGAGDWRIRTEDRPPPPLLRRGDRLTLGPLSARVEAILGHARFVLAGLRGLDR